MAGKKLAIHYDFAKEKTLEGPDQNRGSLVNRTGAAEEKAAKALCAGTREYLFQITICLDKNNHLTVDCISKTPSEHPDSK